MYDHFVRSLRYGADADHPSAATIERRRQQDLRFIAWLRLATVEQLREARPKVSGWRGVAIERALKKRGGA